MRQASTPEPIASVQAAAAAVGFEIPPEYLPGVAETFAQMAAQAQLVMDFDAADSFEPAGVFRP